MQWVLDNWIWILFGVGMLAMHLFGHGGHGGHGKGGSAAPGPAANPDPADGGTADDEENPRVR